MKNLENKILFSKACAVLAFVWAMVIFANSMKNGVESSGMSAGVVSGFSAFLSSLDLPFETHTLTVVIRKLAHVAEYTLFSLLLSLFVYFKTKSFKSHISTILLIGLLLACFDELIQRFVAQRSSEVLDVFIDFTGILIGVAITFLVSVIADRKKKKKGN